MNLFQLENFDKNLAVITPDSSFSYYDLYIITKEFQKFLQPHHLIFLLVKNNIESLVGYISSLNNLNPVLPLNAYYDKDQLSLLLNTYKPRYIWKDSSTVSPSEVVLHRFGNYSLVETVYQDFPLLPPNLSLLLSTSGSTGSPKLVRLSKENIISNATSIIDYLNIDENERPVTSLPIYYSFGLSVINSHLIAGATILLTDFSYIQREFWQFANKNDFTSFSGVPYTFEILKKIKFWSMNLPSLKIITQAGGKMSKDLLEYFISNSEKRGIRFFTMYGQTEATARMSYLPPEFGLNKLGSIGFAIPNGHFYIEDENGNQCNQNTIGELIYEGPNVGLGYAENRQDLYKNDENKGKLHTGDMGYFDNEGFFFITGRKKRFLKLFGNRISLEMTEELLKQFLNEVVCTGSDEKLMIFTTDNDFDNNKIIDFVSSKLKIARTAFEIKRIDKIPRSDTGKIQYFKLEVNGSSNCL